MRDYLKLVNIFQGNGRMDLPKPEGIASKWLFIKAQVGNTHPHAAYPYGKMTVGAYTGAYPTGYGNLCPSSHGRTPEFDAHLRGFSHIHQTGTGAIGYYYNYAVTSPTERLGEVSEDIVEESGNPGYYTATLSSGVRAEFTVNEAIAIHRYTLPRPMLIQIDMANNGCTREFEPKFHSKPRAAEIEIVSPTTITARVVGKGDVPIYFAITCPEAEGVALFDNYEEKAGDRLVPEDLTKRFGAVFRVPTLATVRVAYSFGCREAALADLEGYTASFDETRQRTEAVWQDHLGRIEIEAEGDIPEIFYSNLYHSMLKPSYALGDSFIEGCTYFDFSTLWDMYKTSVPLTMTLFKEHAAGIVDTFIGYINERGKSPISMPISYQGDIAMQARMLVEHCFADFYFRYKEKAPEMLAATERDLAHQTDFIETGLCERYTHVLDICEALAAMSEVARREGDERWEEWYALSHAWQRVFDKEDGLLSRESKYYEGNRYNYSFRPMRDIAERMLITGRREDFIEKLDEMFGYTREPVTQMVEPVCDPLEYGLNSFEGFNNESDMEAPYSYIEAGEHYKCAEIVDGAKRYIFTTGRGGLPGNNDSGALSSHYVLMTLGIYPIAGQDKVYISSPSVKSAKIRTGRGTTLEIRVKAESDKSIYVGDVFYNGRRVENYAISVEDMMSGGILEIYKTDKA